VRRARARPSCVVCEVAEAFRGSRLGLPSCGHLGEARVLARHHQYATATPPREYDARVEAADGNTVARQEIERRQPQRAAARTPAAHALKIATRKLAPPVRLGQLSTNVTSWKVSSPRPGPRTE
jgi:hypothetical protein